MNDVIQYRPRPSDEHVANLRPFITTGVRSDPPTFAGRGGIFRHCEILIRAKRRDPTLKSVSHLILGTPGAEKTLMNELALRLLALSAVRSFQVLSRHASTPARDPTR